MALGVILVNLGTPADPSPKAVRRFLRQFLSDRRVVEIPRLLWLPILYGVILPFRPRRVARAYASLWSAYGDSPLRTISERQCRALEALLGRERSDTQVARAVCYGAPAIADVADELLAGGADELIVLPLYPQYSATTTAPVFDQLGAWASARRRLPTLTIVRDYHDEPRYIEALANSVRSHWQQHGSAARLLLSFHGIPKRNVERGDPYYEHCSRTATLLAETLELDSSRWAMSFQSRLGRAQWLQPYTSELLQEWGREKLPSVDVLCPAFAADCLETLEEIDEENRQLFLKAGGGRFHYIPCLNDRDDHIAMMRNLVNAHSRTDTEIA